LQERSSHAHETDHEQRFRRFSRKRRNITNWKEPIVVGEKNKKPSDEGGKYFILLIQGPCLILLLKCGSRSLFRWSPLVYTNVSLDGDNELNMIKGSGRGVLKGTTLSFASRD
jgi:hypothetical protein